MKNNAREPWKVLFFIAAITLSCLGMLWLLHLGFNGEIKEWVYNLFYLEPAYSGQGKVGVIYKSWLEIKQFIIYVFLSFVIILALGMSISASFHARYTRKKELNFLTEVLNSFLKSESDDLTLPPPYKEIEVQLLKIKAVSQKHQQLMQMEMQRKNDLITYLAHDLKTPLASVIGYLSLLNEAPDMPTEQKAKYSGIALEKAYRLEELINEFFDITRFNLQSIVLNKSPIKLAFMLQQLAEEFYPMLKPQGKRIVIQAADELSVVGDADKLARVFNNILKNALAYSYEKSIIDITVVQEEGKVHITFTNQGDPIPAQKLETIFEKFYRLDSARSTTTGGTGLGLAIAQEIMTAHNGTITVESNSEHTTFTVTLPA